MRVHRQRDRSPAKTQSGEITTPPWRLARAVSNLLWYATITLVVVSVARREPRLDLAALVLFLLSFVPIMLAARAPGNGASDDDKPSSR
jgi:hypothetical protein